MHTHAPTQRLRHRVQREAEYLCVMCGSGAIGRPGICCGLTRWENCANCNHVHQRGITCGSSAAAMINETE